VRVFEQIDIAWDLLMQDTFRDLRHAICATDRELRQFRQLVVNAVMATEYVHHSPFSTSTG
jgi:hypothetical protein